MTLRRSGALILASALVLGATVPTVGAATPPGRTGIAGTITDRAGHPLAHVRVAAEAQNFDPFAETATTDSAGRYSLETGPGDSYLDVDASQATGGNSDSTGYYAGQLGRLVHVAVGAVTEGADLRLWRAGVITGRVTDDHGRPLSGVRPYVTAIEPYVTDADGFFDGDFGTPAHAMTRNGRYRVTGVAPGAYRVCFNASDVFTIEEDGFPCATAAVSVRSGLTARAGTAVIDVAAGGGIGGTARGFDRPGVDRVVVAARGPHHVVAFGVTSSTGRYRMRGLPAGAYRVCLWTGDVRTTSPTGYAPRCLTSTVAVRRHHTTSLVRTLSVGAATSGTIVGAHGSGLAGAPVELRSTSGRDVAYAVTDSAGRYVMKNLPPGRYDVCATTDSGSAAGIDDPTGGVSACRTDSGLRYITLVAGAIATGVDLHLAAAGGISGTVRDAAGRPLDDVQVDLESDSDAGNEGEFYASTDAHGRYSAVDLPPGKYQVCFSRDFFYEACYHDTDWRHAANIMVSAGTVEDHIDATLPPRKSALTVVATDRAGRAVAGVDAVLFKSCAKSFDCAKQPLLGHQARVVSTEVTDASGRAQLRPYKGGSYTLCLYSYYGSTPSARTRTGYADKCVTRQITIPSQPDHDGTVTTTLVPGGAVRGLVTDKHGHPLAHVRVHVPGSAADDVSADSYVIGGPESDAYTDDHGRFSIRSVRPGRQTTNGGKRILIRSGRVTRHVHITMARPKHTPSAFPFTREPVSPPFRGVCQPLPPHWAPLEPFVADLPRYAGSGAVGSAPCRAVPSGPRRR